MAQLKFTGPAVVTGFPRDKAFSFDLEGERIVIKAGKDVFLTIEREPDQVATSPPAYTFSNGPDKIAGSDAVQIQAGGINPPDNPKGKFDTATATPAQTEGDKKPRKPRSPSIEINDADVIQVDPSRPNPYGKLRGKYFESLQTATGRTVKWWEETAMVRALEGVPRTMLRFFLTEKTVQLTPQDSSGYAQGPVQTPAQPAATPSFGAQVAAPVAGAQWTPPGGQTPQGGATFM